MSNTEDKSALFKLIGLSDQKIEETIKNEPLSNFLIEIINHVGFLANILNIFLFLYIKYISD